MSAPDRSSAAARYPDELITAVQTELVSALKRADALRAEAEGARTALELANRQKDEFIAMLAHELRNPLGPIVNAAEILEGRTADDPVARRAVEILVRQTGQLTRLVDDLLDVARIAGGKLELRLEPIDLRSIVRELVDDLQDGFAAREIAVAVTLPDEETTVLGDPVRLTQAIGNILSNAAKFTEAGGHVDIGLERLGGAARPAAARLVIKDTGIGMAPELLSRVFDPFSQGEGRQGRTASGLGLGMAIARGIVELHHGTIAASSQGPSHGSRFELELPVHEGAGAVNDDSAGTDHVVRRRVVVIDDNVDAGEVLEVMLESAGHTVAVARSGTEGIALAHSFAPDVVLCDIGLPGGVDGFAVARALRSSGTRATLIAVTGYGQPGDRRAALEAGFDAHATKPVDSATLERLVRGELSQKSRPRAPNALS